MDSRLNMEVVATLSRVRDDLLRDGREDAAESIRIVIAILVCDLANGGRGPADRPRLLEIMALAVGLLGLVR